LFDDFWVKCGNGGIKDTATILLYCRVELAVAIVNR
jgi:hypothetical protein